MGKVYERIDLRLGNTIEDAVATLVSYREKGKLVSINFNGVTLYSDTVTMDSAYKEITGKTKNDLEKEREQRRKDYEAKQRAHQKQIPALTKTWMEKGRNVLTEDKWSYWDEVVPIRLNDLYQGKELGACLDIVAILNNNGTLEEAKKVIENQPHSGTSFQLVCTMVKEFADRGQDFATYIRG